ncbi:HAD family hydrolase [Pelotalea chapellei]|uniref:phosphoglycolate phosphatase n=1 Tax=Pelotalea chapellei TaxID=44671 RepID=A0ABS5U3S0_9BACT|nr:HAD-IA family hydrolase [Pelotalea chapellei]MBT1070274.1 HAD-IA family hydrolase [Pelotalea chapellei]
MTVGAVLFDLDGTLVDSLDDLTDAVNYTRSQFGMAALATTEVRRMIGKGSRNLVQQALQTDCEAEIKQGLQFFEAFNTAHIADKSKLYPGIREVLDQLDELAIPLAIVSNKNESLSRLILEALDIKRYFRSISGGDTYPERKPSPLPLMRVIQDMGVTPDETLMVGDSINDILAGRQAGIATIGCTWGYGGPDELLQADHMAASSRDVADIVLASF